MKIVAKWTKYLWGPILVLLGLAGWIVLHNHARPAILATQSSFIPPSSSYFPKPQSDPSKPLRLAETYRKLPLSFEANHGQTTDQVKFLSRGHGYTLFLTPTEAVLNLRKVEHSRQYGERSAVSPSHLSQKNHSAIAETILRMKLRGANSEVQIIGLEELPGKSNYFIGNNPDKWYANIPTYAKIKYQEVYPSIDLVYYGNQHQLEYDFIVSPGANPKAIQLVFEGTDHMGTDSEGGLIAHTAVGEVRFHKPQVYQEINGTKQSIPGHYVLSPEPFIVDNKPGMMDNGQGIKVSFEVTAYDKGKTLIIDPILSYSAFLGGSAYDGGESIALDTAGNIYITGSTFSVDLPVINPLQPTFSGAAFKSTDGGSNWNGINKGLTNSFVKALAIDPSTSSTLYAGTAGGIFKSTNGGSSWSSLHPSINTESLAIDPITPSTLYAGTDEGVFKSINNGESWSAINVGLIDSSGFTRIVFSLVIDPITPSILYAGTDQGVFKSTNRGGNWDAVNNGLSGIFSPSVNALIIDPIASSTIYAGTSNGIFKSTNGGSSWSAVNIGLTNTFILSLAIDPQTPSVLYAGSSNGIFKSTDGGISWNPVNVGLRYDSFLNAFPAIIDLAVDPINPAIVYAAIQGSDRGIFKSFDGGASWNVTGLKSATIESLAIDPTTPSTVYAGSFDALEAGGDVFVMKLDPTGSTLIYATYLGGRGDETLYGTYIAVDASGNIYITGHTFSSDFPLVNPLQSICSGSFCDDAFITKLNVTGSALFYSTYLGGSDRDVANGVAVDASGNAYVTGLTSSADFPTTVGAFDRLCGSNGLCNPRQSIPTDDAFVTKLNRTGSSFVYSTYLGGKGGDVGNAIVVDAFGNAYVTGDTTSLDFPLVSPLQQIFGGAIDAFVAKLNAAGSALIYSTYLGGDDNDIGYGIALDAFGDAYVTGNTTSINFPTVNPFQPTSGGGSDAFIAKLNATGSAFIYSTYLGGFDDDFGYGIAVDASGSAYIAGSTLSINFPTVKPVQPAFGGGVCGFDEFSFPCSDAFVAKLNPIGSFLIYSSYLGGSNGDFGYGIAVDVVGHAYVTGQARSKDFPTVDSLQSACNYIPNSFPLDCRDAFITKIIDPAIPLTATADYNGDSKADIAVYRPSTGEWFVLNTPAQSFGSTLDIPAPGDYDGDSKADFAFFKPATGEWHVLLPGGEDIQVWGIAGDIPVPGDYDGDRKTDRAVWRSTTGEWWLLLSGGGISYLVWGQPGDAPVPVDYDGDKKTDRGVFRPPQPGSGQTNGTWYILNSRNGIPQIQIFGKGGDFLVPGDYDGDGKANLATWSSSTGVWTARLKSGESVKKVFGIQGDLPVPADFDGDGKTDLGIFHASAGQWFILTSSSGFKTSTVTFWGLPGDIPVTGSGGR
jgi:photosystem II stability/assembly factor-like uncharacterized protein